MPRLVKSWEWYKEVLMQIIQAPGSIKTATETENHAADLVNAVAKVEFLCLLEGVPVEDTAEQEGAYHD
jgi:hypothetical protein